MWSSLLFIPAPPVSLEYVYLIKIYVIGVTVTALFYFYAYPLASIAMIAPIMTVFVIVHATTGNGLHIFAIRVSEQD